MSASPLSNSGPNPGQAQATAAERDAASRIQSSSKRVAQAQLEADQAINTIRDQYEKQYVTDSARQEAALEAQRTKGYDQIRDLQRDQQTLSRKIRKEGEINTSKLQDHYRRQVLQAEKKGSQQLRELDSQQERQLRYQHDTGIEQELSIKQANDQRLTQLNETSNQRLNQISKASEQGIRISKEKHDSESKRVEVELEQKFKESLNRGSQMIDNLQNRASQQIKQIRTDTAEKLSAYKSRQADPFYKLVDLQAKLSEENDAFVLTAVIPEFEQAHVTATVKGDNLVISGYRRNEEKLDLGSGHFQSSAAYQSFHENFLLSWPVDANRLTRETQGDQMVIRVPKKNAYVYRNPETPEALEAKEARTPKKIRAEHPQFPENLPKSKIAPLDDNQPALGKRTLTASIKT